MGARSADLRAGLRESPVPNLEPVRYGKDRKRPSVLPVVDRRVGKDAESDKKHAEQGSNPTAEPERNFVFISAERVHGASFRDPVINLISLLIAIFLPCYSRHPSFYNICRRYGRDVHAAGLQHGEKQTPILQLPQDALFRGLESRYF